MGPTWGPVRWGLTKQNEKNSILPAIQFRFLRSLVSIIRCEANKSNEPRRGAMRDPLARAPSKCRVTCGGARGLAQHVAAAKVRAEVTARMHNWLI